MSGEVCISHEAKNHHLLNLLVGATGPAYTAVPTLLKPAQETFPGTKPYFLLPHTSKRGSWLITVCWLRNITTPLGDCATPELLMLQKIIPAESQLPDSSVLHLMQGLWAEGSSLLHATAVVLCRQTEFHIFSAFAVSPAFPSSESTAEVPRQSPILQPNPPRKIHIRFKFEISAAFKK